MITFPAYTFPTAYQSVLDRVNRIDPARYARSRNFLNGAVTCLSPYISRGVISTRLVYEHILQRGFTFRQAEKLIQELAWRDYFQQVWLALGNRIFHDIRQPQPAVAHRQLPKALLTAGTGIEAIDAAIRQLEETGYMHNHLRMYLASVVCNVGRAHWEMPASWMYYHLLDGDLASNSCSWQWVAGSFSSKKYYCNQENINRYTGSLQRNSYLDAGYDLLPEAPVPETLQPTTDWMPVTRLPETTVPDIPPGKPVLLYHPYHLDPEWRKTEDATRILVLEPSHFKRFPVSEHVVRFLLDLAAEIPGVQVYCGESAVLQQLASAAGVDLTTRRHPAFLHFPGHHDPAPFMVPSVKGYFPSFFAYWKKIERQL